ncbi:glycerol-3-phosphate acyltransferase 2, mitochondrial isoform X2 [Dendropsophus ebraccatus]|uniref:glycerol-3-phosphate acyltransferase 2, mitochondrial isoform X2 n=1 Tax=Dendropsophus ebraccatus TaxID=150705 RepID=UPI0038311342
MSSEESTQPPNGTTISRICPFGLGLKLETLHPFQGQYRPFVGRPCQSCNSKSMEAFFYKRHTKMGFCNAIRITEENTRYRGWLVRRLCHLLFIWGKPVDQDLSIEWSEKICKFPRIQSAIEIEKEKNDRPPVSASAPSNEAHKEVLSIFGHIQKSLSPRLIRITSWILVKLLNRLYLNLQLHCGQVATLKEASAACPKTPLVFLCTHPSWLDFFLVPFILFSQNLRVPQVAWDGTDCSPLIRWFLQKVGVVFIPPNGLSRPVGEAVLSAYMETLLTEGQHLLVFLESTPSSSCRHVSPAAHEWIRQMMSAMQSGAVSDILIVPVGISYDSCPGSDGSGRQLASFLGLWRFLTSAFCPWASSLGCARVDFAQPFSLQEYISNYTWKHSAPAPCLRETLLPRVLDTRNSMFDEPALDKDRATAQEPEQALVNGFLLHSLRAAVSCTAIMPSHIIAALLLHKYRVGVSLSRLLSDLPEITEDILLHGFDVAFSGQRWDILRHSLYILRHCTGLYVAPSNDVYVLCRESPNSIRELAQKSSSLLPVFLYEAIGACAIHALLAQLPSLCLVEILFTQDEMIEMMMCLGSLLHRNILIMPPCQNAYLVCQDILDKLVHCGLLSMYEDPSAPAACDTGRRRFVDKLMWRDFNDMSDSDSDIGENLKRHYKLGRSSRNADFFVFLCHLLNPVLKTYERAALFLQERGMAGPEPETDYITRLHQYLLEKAKEDCSYECAERSLAACAVRTFIDLGVFECSQSCHGSILHLSETFLLEDNCKNLTTFIQQFIYRR